MKLQSHPHFPNARSIPSSSSTSSSSQQQHMLQRQQAPGLSLVQHFSRIRNIDPRPARAFSFLPLPQILLLLLLTFSFSTLPTPVGSSNWAQVSGPKRQNTASPATSPWTRRFGFALTVVENLPPSLDVILPEEERSRIYILGGDTQTKDTTVEYQERTIFEDAKRRPRDPNYNQVDNQWFARGSGDLQNDVWWTTGAVWKISVDERLRGQYNDPTPLIVSNAKWYSAPAWSGLPSDVDGWRESLGCCHISKPFPCNVTNEFDINICDAGIDLYANTRRFSPRRGHVAVTVYKDYSLGAKSQARYASTIVVLGGRARSLERMTGDELSGGFIGDPFSMEAARQRAVLLSDVWVSPDGIDWDFTNPGCWVPSEAQVKSSGVFKAKCFSDDDCWNSRQGDAYCLIQPGASRGTCVCRHWSPRERFAALAIKEQIYIAGGLRYSQQAMCGKFSCGVEYKTHLNDVWLSEDLGVTWTELTPAASWEPRADFALVQASSRLWVFGGQGGNPTLAEYNPLFSDAYVSTDGKEWALNITDGGYSPRAFHAVHSLGNTFHMLFGNEQYNPTVEEIAILEAAGKTKTMADLTPAEQVALAASQAPSNVLRAQAEEYVLPSPGEIVNGVRMITTSSSFVHYLDDLSADGDLHGRSKNIWWKDYGPEMMPQYTYVGPDKSLRAFGYDDATLQALATVGFLTIEDLASPERGKILRLQDTEDLNVPDICYGVRRAQYIMSRCGTRHLGYDAEYFKYVVVTEAGVEPPKDVVEDIGCDDFPPGAFSDFGGNDQPCSQHPPPRRGFGSSFMEGKLYVAGGWEDADYFANDLWYRDDVVPVGKFTRVPGDQTADTIFEWDADEPGCVMEYQVQDGSTYTTLREWSRAATPFDALDINEHRRSTVLSIRAIDPAGNRDDIPVFRQNVWQWTYIPPLPVLAIALSVIFGILIFSVSFWAYRRYQKKKALERYMAKRLARKLKAGGADADATQKKKKKNKKKKKEKRRSAEASAQAAKDAAMRNKFRSLLKGRAGRANRDEVDLLTRRPAAKDVLFQDEGIIHTTQTRVQREMMSNQRALADEAKRAKAAAAEATGDSRMGRAEGKAALALAGKMRQEAVDYEAKLAGFGVAGQSRMAGNGTIVGGAGEGGKIVNPAEATTQVKIVTRHVGGISSSSAQQGIGTMQVQAIGNNTNVPKSALMMQGNGGNNSGGSNNNTIPPWGQQQPQQQQQQQYQSENGTQSAMLLPGSVPDSAPPLLRRPPSTFDPLGIPSRGGTGGGGGEARKER